MTDLLPGTEVIARGLRWEVVETQPLGEQIRVRLRGTGEFSGFEMDILTPFETLESVTHEIDPIRAGSLPNWIVYHQAFLLEQALGPDAFLVVQPGRLRIEPYQLVPLSRALRMTRPRLLLADDVGLGKTIEAGLIIGELMARRRAHRVLIVTPAGPLLEQWQFEMLERFGLRLEEANRSKIEFIRRGTELGANPFDHLPLAIASMDFLKQDRVLDEVERALPYDLVVMDEAHHYSETSLNEADRSEASQRRRLAEVLSRQSDALLLLSATPHDGYERSFASLLELLDPSLLDGKGHPREEAYYPHVVRRLKKHIRVLHPQTRELVSFPERELHPIPIAMDEITHPDFVELHRALLAFVAPALKKALQSRDYDDVLAYLALLKRSTSSVFALKNTLQVVQKRLEELASTKMEEIEERHQRKKSLKTLQRKMARFGILTLDEEIERELLEREELAQQLCLLDGETRKLHRVADRADIAATSLSDLLLKAEKALNQDLKLEQLVAEIKAIRQIEPNANILIYTEYVDSLKEVERRLRIKNLGAVLTIHGAQPNTEGEEHVKQNRRTITERFRTQDKVILISTDAAAEGLNLHEHCHHLIHLELPWNPNRLEQRNGRIDRYGQWKIPIIRYIYLCKTFEESILARLMAKYECQRSRLKFMPNTLGMDVSGLPAEGLFTAILESQETLGTPCRHFQFSVDPEEDESFDEDVKALLEEIDSSLNRFDKIAKTYKWLGDQGAAADELFQNQARRALEIGQKVGEVDLAAFVQGAVQSEGGRIEKKDRWVDIFPLRNWIFGLDELPGWDEAQGRLRLTTDINILVDETDSPVGYLGRAHPLVRRSIEQVRHLALGQVNGIDRRVSAARSQDDDKALLFTFLGRMDSQAGRELERLLAIRVKSNLQVELFLESSPWMPKPEDGLPTRGLWERDFSDWGNQAQQLAHKIAKEQFSEIVAEFQKINMEYIRQEQRDLEQWFKARVNELIGSQQAELPLFSNTTDINQPEIERLREFIAQSGKSNRERSNGERLLTLYEQRSHSLDIHKQLGPPIVSLVGMLMLI